MGWLWDAWTWVRDGITNTVNAIVDGVVWFFEGITKGYRLLKHIAGKWIAGALDSTIGSIAVLLSILGLAIGIIFFGEAFAASSFLIAIRAARDKIKQSIAFVAESLKLKFILDTNTLLMRVWDDYRAIFAPLNEAFVGLSKELGFDFGTILLIANLGKSAAVNSLRFVGMDSRATEVEAMMKTQNFLAKVDRKFKQYVMEPGKFMEDFDREILQPYQTEGDQAIGKLYEFLDTMRQEITTKAEELYQVRQDLQGLQEALGPEIAAKFDAALGVYFDHFDNFYLDSFMPILDKVNIGFDTINEMQERNEQKLAELEDKQNDPLANLDNLLSEGIDEQRKYFGIYWDGLAFAVDEGKPELTQLNRALNGGLAKIRDANKYVPRPLPFLELEDLRPVKPAGDETYPGDGWNMGDY